MKRNRSLFLLFFLPGVLWGQSRELMISQKQDKNLLDYTLVLSPTFRPELRERLEQGFPVMVTYTVKLYEVSDRFLIGDKIKSEETFKYEASQNLLSRTYKVTLNDSEALPEGSLSEALDLLFHLENQTAPFTDAGVPTYLLARAKIQKKVFRPPLTLLTLLPGEGQIFTGWERGPLIQETTNAR